jgi:predicted dehydrogenase
VTQPRIAVIGAGGIGSQHARVVAESSECKLALVVDPDPERAELASAWGAAHSTDYRAATSCDIAIVAVPTPLHADIAEDLLVAGIPLLVEKPLADSPEAVARLIETATRTGTPLSCGFVERWNPVVIAAAGLLDEPLIHLTTVRHSPRNPRTTSDVVFDLLIHDLDLAIRLFGSAPVSLRATGWRPEPTGDHEIADVILGFAGGGIASLSADRWAQRKVRNVSASTEHELLELDLVRQDITVYRHVHHELADAAGYRAETVVDIPFVRHAGEPLGLQLQHLLRLADGREDAASELSTLLAPHITAFEIVDALSGPA